MPTTHRSELSRGRPTRRRHGRRPSPRGVLVGAVTLCAVVVLAGCTGADDGVRVRDRDGAGVVFEDQS